MSSWLSDSSELITGSWLTSKYDGHGVLGAAVPSGGTNGPSALYPCLVLPGDATHEIRGFITRWPTLGTLSIDEDGSFVYIGANDFFDFRLYVDGVPSGTDIGYGPGISRVFLLTGASTFNGTVTLADAATSGVFSSVGGPAVFSGTITLDDLATAAFFGGGASALFQDLYALLNPITAGGAWYIVNTQEPPTYPYIVFQRVSSGANVTFDGASDLQNSRIQIDIWSRQISEAVSIENAVENAMAAWPTSNVQLDSSDTYDDTVRAFRIIKDYSVWSTN